MRLTMLIAAICLTAGIALRGAAKDGADYKPLMKAGAGASNELKSALKKEDAKAAQASAQELAQSMAKIEEFWSARGAADAVGFAKNIEQAAADIGAKAGAGDFAGATTLFESANDNCNSCHKAHRKMGLGGFKLK